MKKRLSAIFFAALLIVIFVCPVCAAGDLPRLVDDAGLLSDREKGDLLALLDEISERQQTDIVIVTVNSLEGKSAMEYGDDFFDDNGYGFGDERDGILFLISMEERDWYISTSGRGITAVTDAGLTYMSEMFLDDLSGGEYAAAFTTFAGLCDDFITQAGTGKPYDVGNLPKKPFGFALSLLTSAATGFVISLIATGVMKRQLKTVRSQPKADNYVKSGSMRLIRKNDQFLYRHVDRRERPKKSDGNSGGSRARTSSSSRTHTSSSGRTHGGGGGKF